MNVESFNVLVNSPHVVDLEQFRCDRRVAFSVWISWKEAEENMNLFSFSSTLCIHCEVNLPPWRYMRCEQDGTLIVWIQLMPTFLLHKQQLRDSLSKFDTENGMEGYLTISLPTMVLTKISFLKLIFPLQRRFLLFPNGSFPWSANNNFWEEILIGTVKRWEKCYIALPGLPAFAHGPVSLLRFPLRWYLHN